jgi:hypothetical protein
MQANNVKDQGRIRLSDNLFDDLEIKMSLFHDMIDMARRYHNPMVCLALFFFYISSPLLLTFLVLSIN